MNPFLEDGLTSGRTVLLFVCLAIAFGFEFVNGFHDTANAVATVIYTHSLRPRVAVVISGLCNFTGVFLGGIGVALGIMKLLPVELLVSSGAGAGLAMVLALLVSAILWNVGTWYFGLPASSSHTLIGAILGVGLANSALPGHHFGDGVNWGKAQEVGFALLLSPAIGFTLAAVLLLIIKRLVKNKALFVPPPAGKAPPTWIRALLVMTCGGVSFSHGSNDGQKGVGIVMLILMGLVPAGYALDRGAKHNTLDRTVQASLTLETFVQHHALKTARGDADRTSEQLVLVRSHLAGREQVGNIPSEERFQVRQAILRADKSIDTMVKAKTLNVDAADLATLKGERAALRALTDYAPDWVLVAIAISLGVGTMFGWKRIVVTVGEKIGKSHLTYAQGASAELVAMSTIGIAAWAGLPVSTTHVLSSGIAGTMVAQRSGLQRGTVQSIALAWLLTLPVSMMLSSVLFLGFRTALASSAEEWHVVVTARNDPNGAHAPLGDVVLRLGGSNTIGDKLAPRLAKAFLEHQGATDIAVDPKEAVTQRAVVHGAKGPQKARVEIDTHGTKHAFACLASGACDVGMASRPIHADEAARLKILGDMTQPACEHVIGQDGVAVIVNRNNPVAALTAEQIAGIFTGTINDWATVGGTPGPILVQAMDSASGTFDAFTSMVLHGAGIKAAHSFEDSEALARAVAVDATSIGFVGLPYVKDAKALAIREGSGAPIFPTVFTIATEDYPLTRRLFLYGDDDPKKSLASAFVAFAQSDEGQHIVEASGFVSLALRGEVLAVPGDAPPRYVSEASGATRLSVNFRFRAGGTVLDNKAVRDTDRVIAFLAAPANRSRQVLLLGFADDQEPETTNESTSQKRADTVATLLRQRGVTPTVVSGYGSALPVAPNTTTEGRERNRRVEVWVR